MSKTKRAAREAADVQWAKASGQLPPMRGGTIADPSTLGGLFGENKQTGAADAAPVCALQEAFNFEATPAAVDSETK